jgi:Ribbon-helix-helix protein, copG family
VLLVRVGLLPATLTLEITTMTCRWSCRGLRDQIRLPPLLIAALDEWARAEGVSRFEAVRQLLDAGLHVAPARPTAPPGGTRKRSAAGTRKPD